jgi:hypothetical protein
MILKEINEFQILTHTLNFFIEPYKSHVFSKYPIILLILVEIVDIMKIVSISTTLIHLITLFIYIVCFKPIILFIQFFILKTITTRPQSKKQILTSCIT